MRDVNERIKRAKQECAAEEGSPEYREKVIRQEKVKIHREMTAREIEDLTARIRGYDVILVRLLEVEARTGMRKIKMFVDGSENPDPKFDEALVEVAGLNDGKEFNVAVQATMDLKNQAGIQVARTDTRPVSMLRRRRQGQPLNPSKKRSDGRSAFKDALPAFYNHRTRKIISMHTNLRQLHNRERRGRFYAQNQKPCSQKVIPK